MLAETAAPPPTSTRASSDGDCSINYNLPGDIGQFGNDPPFQQNLDVYSWQMFLSLNAPSVGQSVSTTGDNATLWGGAVGQPITSASPGWSSTDDLLLAATTASTPSYGTHYYPSECQSITNYQSYRVIDEISKVDDDFFEAGLNSDNQAGVGLSSNPVVASNGTFLRYEILLSGVTYQSIVQNQWYLSSVLNSATQPLSFPCGSFDSGGSSASPADTGVGAITLKVAWMDATGLSAADYHMERLLVYTSASQNSTGKATCELKTMAMVGMHIAHKTTLQNGWTWSTFEHAANAPDCGANPPATKGSSPSPNSNCPTPDGTAYNLAPSAASDARFASCNQAPAANGSGKNCDENWCVDLAPSATSGYSHLCRQVPLDTSNSAFRSATEQSAACNAATGTSVWSNYVLVSTEWFTSLTSACANAASTVSPSPSTVAKYAPQVTLDGFEPNTPLCSGSTTTNCVPYLGNTSMESYERSNCMGCHSKAITNAQKSSSPSTDMMFFLMLEVPAAPVNQSAAPTGSSKKKSG